MTSFVEKTATVAMYALAALPFIALGFSAHAETATVKISDLNMSQPAQVQTFDRRVDQAAHQICASYAAPSNLGPSAACTAAVRAEAQDKLTQVREQSSSVASR
jgi:UrcA family protein